MKITLDVATVSSCNAVQCAFHGNGKCHARAITVGNQLHAACDTFVAGSHNTADSSPSGVGACKVSECRYNSAFSCTAQSIRVGVHDDHADCLTFESLRGKIHSDADISAVDPSSLG